MTGREGSTPEVTTEHQGDEVEDRESMSPINPNLAAPIDAAVALNVPDDEQDVDSDS